MTQIDLDFIDQPKHARPVRRLTVLTVLAQQFDKALLKAKRALGWREKMLIGSTELILSPGHTLALNQRHHQLYDRFLPHLARSLEPDSMIIDVGANCGDTLAAMHATNPTLRFVAIEPHDEYYALLEHNVSKLSAKNPFKTHLVKTLVGCSSDGMTLVQSGGTARLVFDPGTPGAIRIRKLDEIIDTLGIDQVRVLKSDVDGFDFDVLDSSQEVLTRMQPIIFFEAQIDHSFQRQGFAKTLATLERLGYSHWVLFDNFGSVALRTDSRDVVDQLIDYTWQKRNATPWRTIYYFDILSFTATDCTFVGDIVKAYENAAADVGSTSP